MATTELLIDPSDTNLSTRYIYKMMQTEYFQNGSVNRRFIPVLMSGSTRQHVPGWLQNTIVYTWPASYKDLFFYMIGADNLIRQFICSNSARQNPLVCTSRS